MKAAVVPSINGKWEVKEWPTPKAGPNQVEDVYKLDEIGKAYYRVAEGKVRYRAVIMMS